MLQVHCEQQSATISQDSEEIASLLIVWFQFLQRRRSMKMRSLIRHRSVMLPLLMCCLLALLAACTVNFGPSAAGTAIGSPGPSGPSQPTQGTALLPLSRYLIVNAGGTDYAIDAATGTVIWNLQDYSLTTPVVANGQVYVVKQTASFSSNAGSNQIVDIDERSGTQHWSYSLGQQQLSYVSMALVDNVVVADVGNVGLIGVNAQTGATLWQVALGNTYASGTGGLQTSSNVVYIPTDNSLDAFEATTGHLLWQKSNALQVAGSPGSVFVPDFCSSASYTGFCLNAYSPSSGAPQWSSPVGVKACDSNTCSSSPGGSEPFVDGNTVYSLFATYTNSFQASTQDSYIDAFNASTGSLLWEYSIPDSHGQIGSNSLNFNMIGADSSAVYYENSVGTITALSSANHAVLWKYVNPNGQVTQFLESNGAIELLNDYTVTALNRQTGAQLWVAQLLT
jgi:hypothetical protein